MPTSWQYMRALLSCIVRAAAAAAAAGFGLRTQEDDVGSNGRRAEGCWCLHSIIISFCHHINTTVRLSCIRKSDRTCQVAHSETIQQCRKWHLLRFIEVHQQQQWGCSRVISLHVIAKCPNVILRPDQLHLTLPTLWKLLHQPADHEHKIMSVGELQRGHIADLCLDWYREEAGWPAINAVDNSPAFNAKRQDFSHRIFLCATIIWTNSLSQGAVTVPPSEAGSMVRKELLP